MKIDGNSQLPLTALKGALLINEHGAEFRIEDFVVQLDDVTDVWVSLREYDKDGELLAGSIGISVEFTPEQWAEYKEAMNLNYGETVTKKSAQVWMKGEAEHGLEHHFEVQGMNNGEVTIT